MVLIKLTVYKTSAGLVARGVPMGTQY